MDPKLLFTWLSMGFLVLMLAWPLYFRRQIPPTWWYVRPLKRRAIRLALEACRERTKFPADWGRCWVERCDAEKTFVVIGLDAQRFPPAFCVFVVWHERQQAEKIVPVFRGQHQFRSQDIVLQYESNLSLNERQT